MAANTYNWQGASNRWYEFDVGAHSATGSRSAASTCS